MPLLVKLYLPKRTCICAAKTMTDYYDQSHLRQHLAEIKRAAHGMGRDFSVQIQHLDRRIVDLGHRTGSGAERAADDLKRDLTSLGRSIDEELSRIPRGAAHVGQRIGTDAKLMADATAATMAKTAHRAKEGTQDLFAKAAGVKRTPMRKWSAPPDTRDPLDRGGGSR